MSGAAEEPPGPMEGGLPDEPGVNLKESCEQSKSQLESLKEIMLRKEQSLKKKEEEIQVYAKKLSKFKSRAKLSRRSKGEASAESTPKSTSEASLSETLEEAVDDSSRAKTAKAKSSLLQRKLAEDKMIFEQRSKEITENKRAVEEKVEAIRQQLQEREQQTITAAVNPVVSQTATPLLQMSFQQDKDNKIAELSNRIIELEAMVLDLRENLKEKDSVIDSKTKAVTLMSEDLSKRGKTTLDTLEDTKDEMRTMQEHFVLLESSLRNKNDNLLGQLQEKSDRITDLENTLLQFENQLEAQKLAESASVDFSRSTMDTLADTKDAMKSMQENFVLIESSLKSKNDHLLQQLEERETKLAEAKERIFQLESGAGITRPPETEELEYKFKKSEESNRRLQDEKYELQKNIAELQNKVVDFESTNVNGVIVEKDNRIAELESLIEELKKSNQLLEEESKAELQKQLTELLIKNEEISNKVIDLEKVIHDLETEKNELAVKIPSESRKEDEKVVKLTKELEELNKGMIKLKAQHKSKVKNLQRQLESFRKVSDVNAELVRLGNHVALLEEEKGNLQLSLVDFDELKASAADWKEQIADLEGKVSAQAKEIQTHIEAIAALENQKLDLMQELHSVKQEISTLEAENAESENLRVTAEMKVVDLEEQLEAVNRTQSDQKQTDSSDELIQKIESLTRENEELLHKVSKLEEKGTSDAGSTESFETLHETDRSDLLKKIEELSERNKDLTKKLSILEEKVEFNVGSTESFESINDTDKNDLLKKIDLLTRENSDLIMKLNKNEEKGSSDTGSTESFEKIPEQSDSITKIELLTRENNDLVIKLTKLEEKLAIDKFSSQSHTEANEDFQIRIKSLMEENEDLKQKLEHYSTNFLENNQLDSTELSQKLEQLKEEKEALLERVNMLEEMDNQEKSELLESESATIAALESEIESCKKLVAEQKDTIEDLKLKLDDKEEELERKIIQIKELKASGVDVQALQKDLQDSTLVIEEWKRKCDEMQEKMKNLETGKALIEQGLQLLQDENRRLVEQAEQKEAIVQSLKQELDNTISFFESKLEEQTTLITDKEKEIASLKDLIKNKEKDLTDKYAQLQNEMITIDSLQDEIDQRKNDLQQKDAAIVSLTEEVNELKVSYKKEIISARKEIEELQKQLKSSKSSVEFEELLHKLEEKDEHLNQLETKLKIQESEISALQAQIESVNDRNKQLETEINQKVQELEDTKVTIDHLEEKLKNAETVKAEGEKRIEYLQNLLDTNTKYAEDLKTELNDAYQTLEQLKVKHMEDMNMQNRRLEDIIEDLHSKIQESEGLKMELQKTHMLISKNVTEESQKILEAKISDLEQQLAEAGEKSQKQLEKMKKIAVNLKRKSALCEELESKLNELEEKLTLEKDEKEAKNREIQEKDAALKDKENKISSLEEKFLGVQHEKEEALLNIEKLIAKLNESRHRMDSLMKMVLEMGEESFEGMIEKCRKQQQDLDEAKDNVRELSVRMQVMETEYVEQLALIQSLKTENGMLASKQSQINEKLENVEKESEDRQILLDQLRMEVEKKEAQLAEKREAEVAAKQVQETQTTDSTRSEEGSSSQCERCDQCQTLVHALEARLQERDAEIENLDNELANSIGNFVQMQENLRFNNLMNQSAGHNRSLQEPYNDLMMQYNTLISSTEEIKGKLNETLKENHELTEKIESLRDLNSTLEERTFAVEQELTTGKATTETLQTELEITQQQLVSARSQAEEWDLEKKSLLEKCHELEVSKNRLIEDLTFCNQKISKLESELDNLKMSSRDEITSLERPKRDLGLGPERTLLFDASKAFGIASMEDSDQSEISKLREVISEKDILCRSLSAEIERLKTQLEDTTLSVKIQELEVEKSDYEVKFQKLLQEKEQNELSILSQTNNIEKMKNEKEELEASHEFCKFKILQLENEIKNSSETGRVRELEDRTNKIQRENELLQLQVNDLTRALEDAKELAIPARSLKDVQAELEVALKEKDNLSFQVENLTQTLKKLEIQSETGVDKTATILEEKVEKTTASTTETGWETEMEKLDVEDEGWGWNPEDVQLADDQHLVHPLASSPEVQLHTRIAELEDRIKDLEAEKTKILEDNRNVQTKCGKLIKKLREYKVQIENLQQQLKSRKFTSDLCDLDSVFKDEMNTQILGLEKALADAKEEHRKALTEKENLMKRLDVLMAANERHVEMKERQDMELEVWEIRNKELTNKLEALQKQIQDRSATEVVAQASAQVAQVPYETAPQEHVSSTSFIVDEKKYKEEIDDLKAAVEDLAAENEQLQQVLEEQRTNRLAMESKFAESADSSNKIEELNKRNAELQKDLDKLKEEYNTLRKQYEHSLMDANDQVQVMRHNSDVLKDELSRKSGEFETELLAIRREAEVSVSELNEQLQQALREKEELRELLNQRIQEVQSLTQESKVCAESAKAEIELQILIQELRQETSAKQVELDNFKKKLIEKEEELLLVKKHSEELESTNVEMQNRFRQLEESLQTYFTELEKKNGICDSQRHEIERLVASLDEKVLMETNLTQKVLNLESDLQQYISTLQSHEANQQHLQNKLSQAEHELNETKRLIAERNSTIEEFEQELQKCRQELETSRLEIEQLVSKLQVSEQELERISDMEENKTESFNMVNLELQAKRQELNDMKQTLLEKDTIISDLKHKLDEKEKNLGKLPSEEAPKTVDGLPVFRMGGSDDQEIERLKAELDKKQSEIKHLESALSESTYTQIIQELQDTVNRLYDEKAQVELTLVTVSENLRSEINEKQEEIQNLCQKLEDQRQEMALREDSIRVTRKKRSHDEEDEIQRLKDALRAWEQEVDNLRQVLAEKDTQLLQHSSSIDKEMIERLMSEKEHIRLEVEETLEKKLSEKEMEIESLKLQLQTENERLLTDLKLKEKDIENLRIQISDMSSEHEEILQKKIAEVDYARNDLAEKERRLAEVSITKDAEIHNLKVKLHDKEVRIEELLALSEEEEKQLSELKTILETREQTINDLRQLLDEKVKELELIQHALKRHVTKSDNDLEAGSSIARQESGESSANELDLALYMLHQRDVRCEELTLELMQLLEERDTLQLRLSNAIRVNEELRRTASPTKSPSSSSGDLPLMEDPSPSKAEGPVEIAKDALDSSIGENKEALAQKLSQLHTVGHTKDVTLRDDRELRHSQQMSLLAHKDVLSTLPPEAAARIVNANYTLSRDVQSQSSVLMNWLWGKSTPKVMHM